MMNEIINMFKTLYFGCFIVDIKWNNFYPISIYEKLQNKNVSLLLLGTVYTDKIVKIKPKIS